MTNERDILEEIRRRLDLLRDELAGHTVYLFGSRAAGTAGERSDYDIGVDGDRPLATKVFYRISDMFDDIRTLHRIDWVDLQETSAAFRSAARRDAVVIYG